MYVAGLYMLPDSVEKLRDVAAALFPNTPSHWQTCMVRRRSVAVPSSGFLQSLIHVLPARCIRAVRKLESATSNGRSVRSKTWSICKSRQPLRTDRKNLSNS